MPFRQKGPSVRVNSTAKGEEMDAGLLACCQFGGILLASLCNVMQQCHILWTVVDACSASIASWTSVGISCSSKGSRTAYCVEFRQRGQNKRERIFAILESDVQDYGSWVQPIERFDIKVVVHHTRVDNSLGARGGEPSAPLVA